MISEVKKERRGKLQEGELSPLPYFDWDKAKYFYYVARLKSFNQAGQFLKISQSGLSRKVQTLESHLGFKVFTRNQKGVELTRKGEQLFKIIETTFLSLKGLSFDPIVKTDIGKKRHIKISATHAVASYILNDLVIAYNKQHPNIVFEIITEDHLIDVLINNVDIAVRPLDPDNRGIEQDFLFKLQRRLYASEEYIKNFGEPKNVEDLKNHHIIAPAIPKEFPYSELDWILRLGLPFPEKHEPVFTSTSLEILVEAAKQGIGIVASYHQMKIIRESKLINVLPEVTDTGIDDYFMYPNYLKEDQQILDFKSYIKSNLL